MRFEKIDLPVVNGTVVLKTYVPDAIENLTEHLLRPAVVVCGGGAYAFVSPRETEPVALRLAAQGINAYTVEYRTAPTVRYPLPVQDIAAAIAWVRAHAKEDHTDPERISVLGFSAGGHAAASMGVLWHKPELSAPLGLTPEQVRPNAMVLCYPVITGGPKAHRGSFVNATGSEDRTEHEKLSLEKQVTPNAPTTFLWHTWDDEAVPVENSLLMASALKAAGVSCEMHIFQHGHHGLSLCDPTTGGEDTNMLEPDAAQWFPLAVKFLQRL